jgi:MFS superfamily sulfate permease-like transporter
MLGLGLSLALEGVRMMAGDLVLALVAGIGALALLHRGSALAVLGLVALGAGVALAREPALAGALARLGWTWRVPAPHWAGITWHDVATGVLVLAVPQVALTFGNAVLATVEENNTVFPDRPVTIRAVALDHGLMNLAGAALGGIPMCHGAGGMAGHVRFGARSGGALVILGALTLAAGLLFADGIALALHAFPAGVLGLILLLAGLELAAVVPHAPTDRSERLVMLATAALVMFNMAAGFVTGLVLWHLSRRGWLRL